MKLKLIAISIFSAFLFNIGSIPIYASENVKEITELNKLTKELENDLSTEERPDKFNKLATSYYEEKMSTTKKLQLLKNGIKILEPIDNTKNIYYVQTDNVSIKKEANIESKTIKIVNKNMVVNQIEPLPSDWCKVLVGDIIGYIPKENINTTEIVIQNETEIKETKNIENDIVINNENKESKRVVIDGEVVDITHSENTSIDGLRYLGNYKLTFYCPCSSCCGSWANGITATGTTATAGRTIAVDPNVIPYGSEVVINGHTYIAEDCGGGIKGNRIDIYVNSHSEALQNGVQYADIYIK